MMFPINVKTRILLGSSAAAFIASSSWAGGGPIEVIYSEVPTHSSSIIPGTVDAAGDPIELRFKAIEQMNLSPDGSRWIISGRANTTVTTIDTFLLIGSGLTGIMLAQENRPVQGGLPGEVWDFFDGEAGFTTDNVQYVFGGRARGGNNAIFEKVVKFDGANYAVVHKMGDPALGLIDVPANPTGDELFGNSIGALHILDDGRVGFVNTPITNCHSSRYPAAFLANTSFAQSGVTMIGGQVWDSFSLDGYYTTPSGLHRFAIGDTEAATTVDEILAVDGMIVIQEGSPVAGSAIISDDVLGAKMASNGEWIARGDTLSGSDWVVRNGVLVAATGDPIVSPAGPPAENWGDAILSIAINSKGDWAIAGNTSNTDPAADAVIVLNGTQVVVREGDPVDLDGNGKFDDNVFIGRGTNTLAAFAANDLHLTDDGILYFIAPLRDSAGNDVGSIPAFGAGGEAFMRIDVKPTLPCLADVAPAGGNGVVNVDDLLLVINQWGPCPKGCAGDITGNLVVNVDDLLAVINGWGPCP